jgi:hypothetical protein
MVPKMLADQGFAAVLTEDEPRSGKLCAEIRWPAGATPKAPFANLLQWIDAAPWRSRRIKVTGAVRVAVARSGQRAQMWLRVDRPGGMGAFDNMSNRPITARTWADYSITADVAEDAQRITLGLMTFDGATAWWDNVRVEVLGEFRTLTEPPRPLSERGLSNLVAFTRLLGCVRYFHPSDQAAATGWLPFIVAALPQVETADGPSALATRLEAVFHPVAPTVRVFETGKEPALPAGLEPPAHSGELKVRVWEHVGYGQEETAGTGNIYQSKRLVLEAREPAALPSYARPANVFRSDLGAGVGCMVPTALFADDKGTLPHVADAAAGDAEARFTVAHRGARLATVMTAWSILQHFYPYFDVVDANWPRELEVALHKAATDVNDAAFYQTLNRLVVALHDGHGSLEGPGMPRGEPLPFIAELIGDQAVILAVAPAATDLHPGDVLERIDGSPAREAFAEVAGQVSTATTQRVKRLNFAFGWRPHARTAQLEVRGADGTLRKVTVPRVSKPLDFKHPPELDEVKPGVFYLDMTRLTDEEFQKALPRLAQATGLVFDVRGYPKSAPTWLSYLSPKELQSAQWNVPKTHRPDRTDVEWDTSGRWTLPAGQPQLTSNRVFLTDGSAMSYGETVMGIVEAYKLGEIVGEPTAGTNGNVCPVNLPLGYHMSFTGMKVLKHDGSRHHGIGILPTVPVTKTVQAIREGRDEQLERALSLLK